MRSPPPKLPAWLSKLLRAGGVLLPVAGAAA
jgi:hypothetical protein